MRIVAYPRDRATRHLELRVPDNWRDLADESALGLWPEEGKSSLHLSFRRHDFGPGLVPHLMGQADRLLADAAAKLGLGPVFGHGAMVLREPSGREPVIGPTGVPSPDVVFLIKVHAAGNGRFHQMSYILHQESVVLATFLCRDEHRWTGPLDDALRILSSIEIFGRLH